MFDATITKEECVLWIREFFEKNGPDCNAVIGISGGKDSSVVAALCAEALGTERVIGVLMPNGIQSDIDAAQLLVNHLGIRHYTINIRNSVEGLKKTFPSNCPVKVKSTFLQESVWQRFMRSRKVITAGSRTPAIFPKTGWATLQDMGTGQAISAPAVC